jgi:hypothetical protein
MELIGGVKRVGCYPIGDEHKFMEYVGNNSFLPMIK